MNIVIEIIDDIPYKVAAVPEKEFLCDKCVLDDSPKCARAQVCNELRGFDRNYQRLTARDLEKVMKILEGEMNVPNTAGEVSYCTRDLSMEITEHVEKALEAAYAKGHSEGHEAGYLECEQGYSEKESEY